MKQTRLLLLVFSIVFVPNKTSASQSIETINDTLTANGLSIGEFTAKINGLDIWYKISGSGPVCIMPTPGWGPSSDLYFNSLKELEKLFTMVYLDTRGTGRSGKPGEMGQYKTSNFISDIDGVRKQVGVDKVWLMGHSKAGALILEYSLAHPENTKGLVLLDASVGVNTPQEEMQKLMMLKQNEPWFPSASEYFSRQPNDAEDWKTGTKAVMPMFFCSTGNFEKNKQILNSSSLSYHAFEGQKYWADCENDMPAKLKDVAAPTLVVVGMDDFICGPFVAQYAHREIPNSKLLAIPNAGHFPWLEQPDRFFEGIKDFLPKLGY